MTKLKTLYIATICILLFITSCGKDGSLNAPKVSDQETAELFAWAMKTSVKHVAPSSDSQTWSNARVSGSESGSAIVNGSFTHSYDAYSGRTDETYSNVVIEFDKFCNDSYYPRLTGTVTLNGTCSKQYGWSTTNWGQWKLVGENIKLSGELRGTASIAIEFRNTGLDWAAIIETDEGTWIKSN